jgi:hypothetical protein
MGNIEKFRAKVKKSVESKRKIKNKGVDDELI